MQRHMRRNHNEFSMDQDPPKFFPTYDQNLLTLKTLSMKKGKKKMK